MRNGSWTPVFAIAIAADLTTAVLAIAVLKPMRARFGLLWPRSREFMQCSL